MYQNRAGLRVTWKGINVRAGQDELRGSPPGELVRSRSSISKMELSVVCDWPKLCAMAIHNIPNIEIRRATPEDAAAAFALVEEYFSTIGVVLREDRCQFIEEYFAEERGFWLAWVDVDLAGCVGLRRLQPPNLVECEAGKFAEIKRMYVREKFRGRGIAQSLLEAAEEFARKARYACIYLDTTNEMLAAARLYARNGFVRCERYNQNPQAAIFMRKNLRANL